jgi:hypothetical protein
MLESKQRLRQQPTSCSSWTGSIHISVQLSLLPDACSFGLRLVPTLLPTNVAELIQVKLQRSKPVILAARKLMLDRAFHPHLSAAVPLPPALPMRSLTRLAAQHQRGMQAEGERRAGACVERGAAVQLVHVEARAAWREARWVRDRGAP